MKLLTTIAAFILAIPHAAHADTLLDVDLARKAAQTAAQVKFDAAVIAWEEIREDYETAVAANNVTPEMKAEASDALKLISGTRRKLLDATQQAEILDYMLGEGWRARWQASQKPNPDDEIVEVYKVSPVRGGSVKSYTASLDGLLKRMTLNARLELLDVIGAKPTLTIEDFYMVKAIRMYRPSVAARMNELAVFLPAGTIRNEEYYRFRNMFVLCRPGDGLATMKVDEWIDLAMQPAHISPQTFIAGRNKLMLKLARLLIEQRKAANMSTEGEEFDAAFAPIVVALKAPKFDGLSEAVASLGLPIDIPATLNWAAQEAVAAVVEEAAERNGQFTTSWGKTVGYNDGLGSVMFVKGEYDYESWRKVTIAND